MARIDDLLEEIPDITLRAHLEREVARLRKATRSSYRKGRTLTLLSPG